MDDRALLEAAAKAAGIGIDMSNEQWGRFWTVGYGYWNPLTDDGDALRLAVKLKIDIHHEFNGVTLGQIVEAMSPERDDGSRICMYEQDGTDLAAATRRAIVRAAAAIGDAT